MIEDLDIEMHDLFDPEFHLSYLLGSDVDETGDLFTGKGKNAKYVPFKDLEKSVTCLRAGASVQEIHLSFARSKSLVQAHA